jgi:uncharacterized protein with HEPN domain
MPKPSTDAAWLWDTLAAARLVQAFTADYSLEDYEANVLVRSAVERQIEIIGEAARHVSRGFQESHPEIPWKSIMAQRHVLAHDYGEIRNDLVYRVATLHIGELIALLEPYVPAVPGEDARESTGEGLSSSPP